MRIRPSHIRHHILKLAVLLFFGTGLFARCANIMSPQGGPRDTLPPQVVEMKPGFGALDFKEKRIYIEFNEYLQLKDQQKEFYTSPQMGKKPLVTLRGRGIQIDLKDSLLANTTYALNFGSSVADNNEGNPLNGFRYVFSTGKSIDSLVMSGYTVDGYSQDSVAKSFIFFYDTTIDSVGSRMTADYDSTLLRLPPQVVGRAESNGIFITENLKPVPYRIYAFEDSNGNQTYDPGVDKVGFLDTVCNPATMPAFSAWFDTTRKYLVADPQVYMRLFMDESFRRQYLSDHSRPLQHKAILTFGAKFPKIEKLVFEGIDSTRIITEYLSRNKDSIAFWFNVPSEELPDTIRAELIYLKHDSVNVLRPDTQRLELGWKFFDTRTRKEKKEEEKAEKPVNPFKYKVDATNEVNPEKGIPFEFDYPLTAIDSGLVSLIRTAENEKRYRVKFAFERDTANLRRWILQAQWMPGQKYELLIPSGVFHNVAGESNDSLKSEFSVASPEKFATIVANVKGKTPESEYVLQLLSESGSLLQEIRHAREGKHTFRYVAPGKVKLRVLEDLNRNGEWDRGDLILRRQPERVELYLPEEGDGIITTKENWELEFDLDMNRLFAPVTTESIVDKLRQAEAVRMQKRLEQLAKRLNQPAPKPQTNANRNNAAFEGMGGTQ